MSTMLQVRPFRCQKMSRRLTKILEREFQTAPRAPMEQLQKEAKEFEEVIKSRRAAGMR